VPTPQLRRFLAEQGPHGPLGRPQLPDDGFGVGEQAFADGGERHAARVAVQQAGADVAFELGQLLRNGGRGEGKPLRRTGDGPGVRDFGEQGQAVGVEHGSLQP
jgi:hypothetical protein